MNTKKEISAEFLFESKYIEVMENKMYYIDDGEGYHFLIYKWESYFELLMAKYYSIHD